MCFPSFGEMCSERPFSRGAAFRPDNTGISSSITDPEASCNDKKAGGLPRLFLRHSVVGNSGSVSLCRMTPLCPSITYLYTVVAFMKDTS